MKRAIAALGVAFFAAMGCTAETPDDVPATHAASEALEAPSNPPAPPSSSTESSLSVRWQLADGVVTMDPGAKLQLDLTNHEVEALEGVVSIEVRGLGVRRVVALGSFKVEPGTTTKLDWSPFESPIAPVGAAARLIARVAFERGGVAVNAPAQVLSLAFSQGSKRAFVSADDDTGVRLASLGRAPADVKDPAVRAAVVAQLGSRVGTLDGKNLNQSRTAAVAEALATRKSVGSVEADEIVGDAVGFADAVSEADAPMSAAPNGIGPGPGSIGPGPIFPPACDYSYTAPICASWKPLGFRDLGVTSSTVPMESHDLHGRAAYANATVYDWIMPIWQGRLDAGGCTPAVTFCLNRVGMEVSTASLQKPGTYPFFISTREIKIEPASSYYASMSFASVPSTGQLLANATVESADYPVRVASVVSRVLTMGDDGVLRQTIGSSAPTLTLHTENGCGAYPEFEYPIGSGQYGEACAGANDAWFGPTLKLVGAEYVPTGRHTTEDVYTIAHELGHAMQFASNGGPASGGYPGTFPNTRCSCNHVNDGNRLHCLQSSHPQNTAEVEGFAHFYAARVMNDQGSSCRFTYYKNVRVPNLNWPDWAGIYDDVLDPPVPVNCRVPYTLGSTTGWVRNYCAQANTASEYDWLTFLWAVNADAPAAQRSSMGALYAILGGVASSNFTWPNVDAKAQAQFGPNSPTANRFHNSGVLHGVSL